MQRSTEVLFRAKGCLFGQCAGDALGQLVEFRSKKEILAEYPNGVLDMVDGGTFNTIAGQPTDDTEMALMLARSLVKEERFDAEKVFQAYRFWYDSGPFDCGVTTRMGLFRQPNEESQANGSLMRISPLGVFGSRFELDEVANWAIQDAKLTHPNLVCQKSAAIYATTIAESIHTGLCNFALYENALLRAQDDLYYEPSVYEALRQAADSPPNDFCKNEGWVLLALQNAYYRLLHSKGTEQAIIDTVCEGGDTDTNAAICGALLGAVYGIDSIPIRWQNTILNCRPSADNAHVVHPRPECFWPIDVLELAEKLLGD